MGCWIRTLSFVEGTIAPVPDNDVGTAVARHVADADRAERADAERRAKRPHVAETTARELGQHAHSGRETRAGQHDDVVAPVTGHVGDLEIVVGGVQHRVDDRGAEVSGSVVEKDVRPVGVGLSTARSGRASPPSCPSRIRVPSSPVTVTGNG